MGAPPTPGKMTITKTPNQIATTLTLSNFDIDKTTLKEEHKQWLDEHVVPLLKANASTSVVLQGTASKSGDPAHNRDPLSKGRAEAVANYLLSRGADQKQITIKWVGADRTTSTLKEDERDRAVQVAVFTPLTIEKVSLWADRWTKELEWDDIIGLDTAAGWPIDNVNIQVETSGAPRSFMPDALDVFLVSRQSNRITSNAKTTIANTLPWSVPRSETAQPGDSSRTWYRLSKPIATAGRFDAVDGAKVLEVAYVVRSGGTSDVRFREAVGAAFRGRAVQSDTGSEFDESPNPLRLMQAAGVEVLSVTVRAQYLWQMKRPSVARLIRNPADIFYYTGHGLHKYGCLAESCDCGGSGDDIRCWATPKDFLNYWKNPLDLDVLIIAGCSVLDIPYLPDPRGPKGWVPVPGGGPGREWSKLLVGRGGSLRGLLGYKGSAPLDDPVGNTIATEMGQKFASGLGPDQYVRSWLDVNAAHRAWNAIGMDYRGYWFLSPSLLDRVRGKSSIDYDIIGPLPIP
ncbi:MAG: OmpA family protein [Isosphaeraceae bacterium]